MSSREDVIEMRISIATIVVMANLVTACSLPVDEFTAPEDAARDTEADTFTGSDTSMDTGVEDASVDSDDATDAAEAAPPDAGCMCVKKAGPTCKEWQPPGCG